MGGSATSDPGGEPGGGPGGKPDGAPRTTVSAG